MKIRDIVVEKKTGKKGVIVPNVFFSEDGPFAVIMEGRTDSSSVDQDDPDYEIIDHEAPLADMVGCIGKGGADACIFAVVDGDKGIQCERHTRMHMGLVMRNMVAKRLPTELYPLCKRTAETPPETR